VLKDHTSAVLMLCAPTPTDHTTALVIWDTMETAGDVIQVFLAFSTCEEICQDPCYFTSCVLLVSWLDVCVCVGGGGGGGGGGVGEFSYVKISEYQLEISA